MDEHPAIVVLSLFWPVTQTQLLLPRTLSTDISGSSRNEGAQSSQPPGIPNFTFEPPAAFPPSQTPHQHLSSIPDPPREPIPQEIRIFYLLFPLFFHELPFPGAFPAVQDRGGFEAGHHEERWGFCCSQFPSPGFQSFLPRDFRAPFPGISELLPPGFQLFLPRDLSAPAPSLPVPDTFGAGAAVTEGNHLSIALHTALASFSLRFFSYFLFLLL